MARIDDNFRVRHQAKLRLLLRALEQMDTSNESAAETAVVTEMILRLEAILSRRRRTRRLSDDIPEEERRRPRNAARLSN